MTTTRQLEKRIAQLENQLGYVRNRFPGRNAIEIIHQAARMVDDEYMAADLDRLADRLNLIRDRLREDDEITGVPV